MPHSFSQPFLSKYTSDRRSLCIVGSRLKGCVFALGMGSQRQLFPVRIWSFRSRIGTLDGQFPEISSLTGVIG